MVTTYVAAYHGRVTLPPYTFSAAVGRWSFDPPVFVALVLLLLVYLVGVGLARRRGERWPWWRTAVFAVAGLGFVGVCTMSSLAVYDHTHLWALATQFTLLMSLAPVGISLGDPIGLARRALSARGRARLERVLTSPPVRGLTFPVVSAVLAATVTMVVFFSRILGDAVHSATVLNLVYLLMLVVGCLAALPLLGAEILPAWCTEPVKLLFSFADGILDAIPGIVVMTTSARLAGGYFAYQGHNAGDSAGAYVESAMNPNWDAHVAGALMLALTELVTLPVVFILFFRWAAQETKRDLPRDTATASGQPVMAEEPELMRPWWETDGFGPRNARFISRDEP